MKKNLAEIHFTKEGSKPRIEMVVPHGTSILNILKTQELVSRDIISKLSPRGCQACLSGVDFDIRERLENVMLVDLEKNIFVK